MWFVLMGMYTTHEPVFIPKNKIKESDYDDGHFFDSKEKANSWAREYRECSRIFS